MALNLESRFEAYGDERVKALSHSDRSQPARGYLKGLMLPGSRKSVEPMAARVCPHDVRSAHQSMHHRVAEADWSDGTLLATVARLILPSLTARSAAMTWIVDDTGFPKKAPIRWAWHGHTAGKWVRPTTVVWRSAGRWGRWRAACL